MNIAGLIYSFVLFVALTPNILFRFPSKGTKTTVAAVHAIIFGIIYYFTYSFVMHFSGYNEGINWDPAGAGKALKNAFSPPAVQKAFAPVTNGYNSAVGAVNNGLGKVNSFNLNNMVNRMADQQANKAIAQYAPPGTPPVSNVIGKGQTANNMANQGNPGRYNINDAKRFLRR